jgi:hypothetical protein
MGSRVIAYKVVKYPIGAYKVVKCPMCAYEVDKRL